MNRISKLLVGTVLSLVSLAHAQERPTVTTNAGPVVGRASGNVNAFLGLPYAAPPIGDLRFRPPQAPASWTAPRDASAFGNVCTQVILGLFAQPDQTAGDVRGSEDCLYLNVYTPRNASPARRLPVMVWIHGGSFTAGAGSTYDPSVIVEKHDVIAVTINYRLGVFGFLALPGLDAESSDGTSGNYGLMDQQAALRWVNRNITAFGGDPRAITIFGESVGGNSVCWHLASPASAGLFQKAIVQSGLCTSPNNTVSAADAARRNVGFATRLGCRGGDVACLRRLDSERLAKARVPGLRGLGNLVWSPVSGGSIAPLTLRESFESGRFNRVPVLQGTTADEGRLFISLASPGGRELLPVVYWGGVGLLVGAPNATRVLNAYPYRALGSPALAFAKVFTDAMFACPAYRVSTALSRFVPVYAFEFADPNAVTSLPTPPGLPNLGAHHSSSLVYAFQTPVAGLGDPARMTAAQRQLSDAFSLAWVTFAKTGNPGWARFDAARGTVRTFTPSRIFDRTTFAADHQCGVWSSLDLR